MDTSIFKSYDIRGVYPEQLTGELAYAVGHAAAKVLGGGRIAVGRDMRVSSEHLASELIRGLTDAGVDVLDIGLVSTDTVYFVTGRDSIPGIMITASHNPAQYGGIKFCRAGAVAVSQETGLHEIQQLVEQAYRHPASAKGNSTSVDIIGEYGAHLRSLIDASALRPLRVVVDAGNGMGGVLTQATFAGLPMQVSPLYFELDGTFPNHPANPLEPANTVDASAKVREVGADLGIIFDGDADRAFFVDDTGRVIPSSLICAMVARAVLAKYPNEKILYNVVCSKIVPETIIAAGGMPIMERVGHSFIKERMRQENIIFGGEHSGHYYFKPLHFADSGMYASLVILELLSRDGRKLSEIAAEYGRYHTIDETNREVNDKAGMIGRLREHYAAQGGRVIQEYDGLSMDMGTWWFNVRPSGTEPLLRVNLEADTEQIMQEKKEELLGFIAAR